MPNTNVYNNHSQGGIATTVLFCLTYLIQWKNCTRSVSATTLSCTNPMPLAFNYIHAGSPNVTNLTFDDRSRTLTCTSTGGPATTVTWSRDGVVITLNATYQQTQTIVDTVEGTYQTVLTIDPSVGQSDIVGMYNCTVENARGVSSESVVVPGETRTRV